MAVTTASEKAALSVVMMANDLAYSLVERKEYAKDEMTAATSVFAMVVKKVPEMAEMLASKLAVVLAVTTANDLAYSLVEKRGGATDAMTAARTVALSVAT